MIKVLVVVEAEADFRIATKLADRVCCEKAPDWVTENLDAFREWFGFLPESTFACWKDLRKIEQTKNYRIPRALGHLRGEPLGSDGVMARRAVLMALEEQKETPDLKAILFIRDLDTHDQVQKRQENLERVREGFHEELTLIFGLANPKREAWVLNGYEPQNEREQANLEQLRQTLGFDPCVEAHRLRTVSHSNQREQQRNVKHVLTQLTDDEFSREEKCWLEIDLETLRQRGEDTGLSSYLIEVEKYLVCLLGN